MAELNYKNFPDDLHRHLKVEAARAGKTLRKYILDALTRVSGGPSADVPAKGRKPPAKAGA